MKTLKIMTLCCISVLLFSSCEEHHDTGGPMPIAVETPEILISIKKAENLYKRYGTDRVSLIEEAINVDDNGEPIDSNDPRFIQTSRSISFDFEQMKNYIAYIEQKADSAKAPLTGLRIYFGQYSSSEKKYPSTETVFFNPIMEYGKKGDLTDDVSFAIQSNKAVPVGVLLGTFKDKPAGNGNLILTTQSNVETLAANFGGRRPPPPPPYDPDYSDK